MALALDAHLRSDLLACHLSDTCQLRGDSLKVYLNSQQVAEVLAVSPSALTNWRSRAKKDALPVPDAIIGSRPGWSPTTIMAFVEEGVNDALTRLSAIEESQCL